MMKAKGINWKALSIAFAVGILLLVGFVLLTDKETRRTKDELTKVNATLMYCVDELINAEDFQETQEKCLFENKATNYEECYWKARETQEGN
ncbi:MAG: hypothetical protein V1866_04200 [archaeon]